MKVLAADDDPTSLALYRSLLSPFGRVDTVESGDDALDWFRQAMDRREPYDLVCLDVKMPGRTGHQVLSSIRWMERARGVRPEKRAIVLMVSGLSDRDLVLSALRDESDGYVLKPLDPAAFLERLRTLGLLSDGGGHAPPSPP